LSDPVTQDYNPKTVPATTTQKVFKMSDPTPEIEVTVTVPEPETVTPEPDPTPEPVVVVVEPEPAPDPVDTVVVETAIDHEGRIAALESAVALLAVQAVQEPEPEPEPEPVIIEEPQAPVEEDTAPDNEHWFFKKGWF
jgi:hypothetical protein